MAGTARCGKNSGYSRHVARKEKPCDACRKARNAYNKRWRYRAHVAQGSVGVDATGTHRRIQALARIGHRFADIGELLGMQRGDVNLAQMLKTTFVQAHTAEKVRQVYERLSGTPGTSDVTRRRAIAKGWLPPLDWEGRDIDNPRALSHSQHGDLVRQARARAKGLAA